MKIEIKFLIIQLILWNILTLKSRDTYRSRKKQVDNGMGMSLLTHFLTSDSTNKLRDSGGLFDDTGCDGLENESPLPENTEGRFRQKARSAAAMFMKNQGKEEYSSYGCTPDQTERQLEKLQWKSYVVLMMNKIGQHILLKCCVNQNDGINGNIAFVIDNEEQCMNKIQIAEDYFKSKDQFDQNINSGLTKEQQIEKIQKEIIEKRKKEKELQEQQKKLQEKNQQTSVSQLNQDQVKGNNQQTVQKDAEQEQDEQQIQKQMEELKNKLNKIKQNKQSIQQENQKKENQQLETQQKKVSESNQQEVRKQMKIEDTRFNQIQSKDQTNLDKTAKLENEINSMKQDIKQIKDLLIQQFKQNSQKDDNSKYQKRRMRFQEIDDNLNPSKSQDDDLAQEIANMVERQVYDDQIANAKNKPHKF